MTAFGIAALGMGCVSLLIHIIGMATDYWVVVGANHSGLWRLCADVQGLVICGSITSATDRFHAAQAMEILAVLAGAAGLGLLVMRRFSPSLAATRGLRFLPFGLFLLAGVLGIVGVLLFCDPMDACKDVAGWSFIITIIGSVLFIVAAAPLTAKVSTTSEYERI